VPAGSPLGTLRTTLGRAYGFVDDQLTGLVLARRYHLPPEVAYKLPPEALGLRPGELWGEGRDRVYHEPSPWGILGRVLPPREVSSRDVFIDLGCGTGRVLFEAALRYPFRRAIGVDFVPELIEIASTATTLNRDRLRCREVQLVNEDLATYEIPDDVTVGFLYDSVRGPLFDAVAGKLIASVDRNPRRMRLVYFRPREAPRLEATGRARFVRYGRRVLRRWLPAEYLAMYEIEPPRNQDPGS
jgi:SAM-dependent methyltransferase